MSSWPVDSVHDLRLAPFHLMATEVSATSTGTGWHRDALGPLMAACGLVIAADDVVVDRADAGAEQVATARWRSWPPPAARGWSSSPGVHRPGQPGPGAARGEVPGGVEYLRIISGPDHTAEESLTRLRARGLSAKRSRALRAFALGVEGLERFARREPLRREPRVRVGVAMESEPVDPRR